MRIYKQGDELNVDGIDVVVKEKKEEGMFLCSGCCFSIENGGCTKIDACNLYVNLVFKKIPKDLDKTISKLSTKFIPNPVKDYKHSLREHVNKEKNNVKKLIENNEYAIMLLKREIGVLDKLLSKIDDIGEKNED